MKLFAAATFVTAALVSSVGCDDGMSTQDDPASMPAEPETGQFDGFEDDSFNPGEPSSPDQSSPDGNTTAPYQPNPLGQEPSDQTPDAENETTLPAYEGEPDSDDIN